MHSVHVAAQVVEPVEAGAAGVALVRPRLRVDALVSRQRTPRLERLKRTKVHTSIQEPFDASQQQPITMTTRNPHSVDTTQDAASVNWSSPMTLSQLNGGAPYQRAVGTGEGARVAVFVHVVRLERLLGVERGAAQFADEVTRREVKIHVAL